ncbi:MAG: SusD/RagB family nutrient-binding outer membrane lipoprotein [Bacteroidales bacterium]|nr:SusD/RagB family nutrient-binding outer membrane lipoprotein [Bacteroidales bacterium]MCF8402806.1 SusD/RagB family nutrient-binding outer membrane lipoprotein [Bacteroidales bacterium]
MKTIHNFTYTAFILLLLALMSCTKDFEELNKNPFKPTETDIGPLFNTVIESLKLGWDEQFYVHNEVLYKQSELAALTTEAWSNLSIGTEDIWKNYYVALAHVREIEKRIAVEETKRDTNAMVNVKAALKIITAYKTFKVTDLFGDMPFFDAGRGFEGIEYLRPKYDSQEEIYSYLLDDLKWAVDNMVLYPDTFQGKPYYSLVGFDNLLNGDMLMWMKFANSLRLRHAMRIAEKNPQLAGEVISEIIENNLPVLVGYVLDNPFVESVCMKPREQNWLRESSSWAFREHNNLRMGSNIWHQMSNHDSLDGSGIFDPRAFVFFERNQEGEWNPYPQIPDVNTPISIGAPYSNDRDFNYGYMKDCNYSPFNYYLIRDEYDIPEVLMTGAEVHYIKAEAYMRGIGVAADPTKADLEYFAGARASVEFWTDVMASTESWENIDPLFINTSAFNVANLIFFTEDKLALIYAQRWLDAFRQPGEAFALTRRTGMTPREGDPINYFRLPYPPSEKDYNTENCLSAIGNQGGDDSSTKLWWIP